MANSATDQPNKRLKLILPSSEEQQASLAETWPRYEESTTIRPVGSPPRPSYSPVTPTFSQPSLATSEGPEPSRSQTQWIDEPEPLPVSLEENPDAMALRAAISVLQLQKQQTLRDMRQLDRMKQAALQDPDSFVKDLKDGKLAGTPKSGIEIDDDDSSEHDTTVQQSTFGKFPTPQNVIRCPPIEWNKYHIAGEPLERMHEFQRRYPGNNLEERQSFEYLHPHNVAAPYQPFADKVDP